MYLGAQMQQHPQVESFVLPHVFCRYALCLHFGGRDGVAVWEQRPAPRGERGGQREVRSAAGVLIPTPTAGAWVNSTELHRVH